MRRLVILAALLSAACRYSPPPMTAAEAAEQDARDREAAAVRITINPEAVRGCKSLGIVIYHRGSQKEQLQYGTAQRGGNVALAVTGSVDEGQPLGEAYLCEQPKP